MNLNKSGRTVTATISGSVFIITEQIFGNTPDLKIHGSGNLKTMYYHTIIFILHRYQLWK